MTYQGAGKIAANVANKRANKAQEFALKLATNDANPDDYDAFICGVLSSKALRKLGFTSIKEQGRNALARTPTSKQITPDKEVPEMPDNSGILSQTDSASNSQNSLGNWQSVGSVAADLVKKVATK